MKKRGLKRRYILYDGRAAGGDTEDASVFCFEDTWRESMRSARSFGEACIYSFIEKPTGKNERGEDTFEIFDQRLEKVVRT